MLEHLNKKNNPYITRSELEQLIQMLSELRRGEPGKDATISPSVLKDIVEMAKPIKGVDYKDGKPGVDGKTIIKEETLSGEEMIRRISEADTKLSIPFSAVEDGHELLNTVNSVIRSHNDLSEFAVGYYDEYVQLRDKVQAITVEINNPPKQEAASLPDGFLSAVSIDCPTGIITFNVDVNGTPTPLTLDASCLKTKQACETFNPTTEGIAQGFSDGSQWYNTTTGELFTFMCGNWIQIQTGTTTVTQQCDVLLDQAGNAVVDGNGNVVLINCVPVITPPTQPDAIVDQAGNVLLDGNGNAIVIN